MQHNLSFVTAKALHTAVDLDIFTILSKQSQMAKQLANNLQTDSAALDKLLRVLVMLGLLKKNHQYYDNSPTAEMFLVKGKPAYMGPLIEQGKRIWKNYRFRGPSKFFHAAN